MAEADYTDEIWKTIPFAPNYAVSNMGRVRRAVDGGRYNPALKAGRLLKLSDCGLYLNVRLKVDGRVEHHLVNRLVARCFLGEPPTPRHVAAHENGMHRDNRAKNLAWKTQADNIADKDRHGTMLRGDAVGTSKLTPEKVIAIRCDRRAEYVIALAYGVSQAHINRIRRRQAWGWLD